MFFWSYFIYVKTFKLKFIGSKELKKDKISDISKLYKTFKLISSWVLLRIKNYFTSFILLVFYSRTAMAPREIQKTIHEPVWILFEQQYLKTLWLTPSFSFSSERDDIFPLGGPIAGRGELGSLQPV
jgi:hypothetical protein